MLLKIGSTGVNVITLQKFLNVIPDGSFGIKTEHAVKEWQRKNNLVIDGIVGPVTWSKMGLDSKQHIAIKENYKFKLEKLKGHIPDSVILQIPDTATKFNITNPLRLSHFLSQCGHESAGWTATSENLNYSADGLKRIFSKYFPGNLNESYARQPEKIASRVYASRMGNGDESTKDGWKYRGRGYIQLTGKHNYISFGRFIGEDLVNNPDLVATKYPLSSAAFFFDSNKLWSICDKGSDDATVIAVTRRVNGGTIGLADRINHFRKYYNLLR